MRLGIAWAALVAIASAQAPLAPQFDAASIRPSGIEGRNGPVQFAPGRVFSENVHLFRMIQAAYQLGEYQLERKPPWIDSENFAFDARASASTDENQLRLMLQTFLSKRFKLTAHYETRQMEVYALVVGRNGTRLHEWKRGDPVPPRGGNGQSDSVLSHKTLGNFVAELNLPGFNARYGIDRPVLDETNLKGIYLFNYWLDSPEDFRAAVIEDQLGLKLESRKAPVDILVIDHIEQPSDN